MVSANKKRVEVTLLGQRFCVRSERDEAYMQELAKSLTEQIEELRKTSKTVSTHHLALLVALNLADELQQKEERIAYLTKELSDKTKDALAHIERALSALPPDPRQSTPS